MKKERIVICWFRRDLRLHDNAALYHALRSGLPVLPLFIFDRNILDKLEDKHDRRVTFIHRALESMQRELNPLGSSLEVLYDTPIEAYQQLLRKYDVAAVYTNHDYEAYAKERDAAIAGMLQQQNCYFYTFKDTVILEKDEVVKDDGKPYSVFTPYSKRWKLRLNDFFLQSYPTEKYFGAFLQRPATKLIALEAMGFQQTSDDFPAIDVEDELIKKYSVQRDFPGINGTSKLGVHLRFGTTSIRQLASRTKNLNETFLNELIWRDFYHMILWNFPHVGVGRAFRPEYDRIEWRNNEEEFARWCEGKTGYPIVDAGMRQLNATGYMHNRVRMIVASFLTKHLLIDWRWGEAYFAQKLLDFDLAANNGGWQWASGSGCDAAPYFRVFNPTLQTQRFDKDLRYVRQWVPEVDGFNYCKPIVVHEMARKRCLEVYGKVLKASR
jgi:deoxyribodipyrimidine photo-lyase